MKHALHFALIFLLLLSACGGGPRAVEKYVGTDGITIEFAENAPPETVYEDTAFPARVLVRNAGATDVAAENMVLTFSVDPLYIMGGLSPYFPARHDTEHKIIYGKSPSFPDGQLLAYSMPIEYAFSANKVLGQRTQPETTIVAGVCYSYTTHYSASVCIDTNAYGENLREQPCVAEDLSSSGGQGAPIAITNVRVQAFPVIDRTLGIEAVRPQFTFTIEDVGNGQLVGPDTLELASACLLRGIQKEELGAVRIEAYLLNTPLECQPGGLVRLVEGKGEVRCTVAKNDLTDPMYASAQNYQSTLIVNISYIYKSSTSVTVEIERVPGGGTGEIVPVGGRATGYEYVRAGAQVPQVALPEGGETQLVTTGPVITDSTGAEWQVLSTPDGQPVTSCELYANNPELIPSDLSRLKDVLTPAWSCACGQARCTTLTRSGLCVAGLCPGSSYCCAEPVKAPTGTTTTGATGSRAEIINTIAQELGVEARLVQAFITVESGKNHKVNDRLVINFEPTHFKRYTGVDIAQSGSGQSAEWTSFERAKAIDEEAACKSISMGLTQILGSNYALLGYGSAVEMFSAFDASEDAAIYGFRDFIKSNAQLHEALRTKDYHLMAYYYNGAAYADAKYLDRCGRNYAERIQRAYEGLSSSC